MKVLFLMLEKDGEDQFDVACENEVLLIAKEQMNILHLRYLLAKVRTT
jgi:hypothetical protein